MPKPTPDHHDAELLLHVPDLRREALIHERIQARVARMAAARG